MIYEAILILVGTAWAFSDAKRAIDRRKKVSKTVATNAGVRQEQIRSKWYQKHYPEFVEETVANGVRTRCLAKTYRNPADLDPFEAWCECPMCADIGVHWLGSEGWLIRQTRNGQVQDKTIERQCRNCQGTWSQLI